MAEPVEIKPPETPLKADASTQPGADPLLGLTAAEVSARLAAGEVNKTPRTLTRTIPRIFRDNLITFFNILILVLFVLMISAGEYKNSLFFFVCIANIAIGTFQEIRSKLTIDRLSVITQSHVHVMREGRETQVSQEEIVLGDVVLLALGNQICADGCVAVSHGLEIDESLITGESRAVKKAPGDEVFSGSHVIAGSGTIQINAVGKSSYANQLTAQARYEKQSNSQLMRTINFLIKSLTFALIPLGVGLFLRTYLVNFDYSASILAATAASIGMIPAGLVLLTSVAFAMGALTLVRHKTLTQSMPAIETLARVDVLCLDKTGTITDGSLAVDEIVPLGHTAAEVEQVLSEFVRAFPADNKTALALSQSFAGSQQQAQSAQPLPQPANEQPQQQQPEQPQQPADSSEPATWTIEHVLPFSSARKYSACSFTEQGTFVLGAPEFVLAKLDAALLEAVTGYASRGLRVLLLAQSELDFGGKELSQELSQSLAAYALIVLTDHVRAAAPASFAFFREQGVEIKVISGDDPETVSTIAQIAGIDNAKACVDMSKLSPDASLETLMNAHTVFGRTSPNQKRDMIRALQHSGKTVAMTGDGVNDAMALRVADVGIAMASGSEATRTAADFVLVDSDFSSMIEVVRAGRRVVNNIEGVASLYITKTIYSVVLTLLFTLFSFAYPFQPIQLTLLGFFMIGTPSLFLTFEPNYQPMHDRFVYQLVKDALPAAALVIFGVIALQVIGLYLPLSAIELSTLSLLLNGVVCMCLLVRVCQPMTRFKLVMVIVLIVGFLAAFFIFGDFFEITSIFSHLAWIWVPLLVLVYPLYELLTRFVLWIEGRLQKR